MKIKDLKLNEKNPRRIKGERLATLKKSIQDFEKMLELRPIIVDENNVVLGGNMRLQALKALGYKDIPDNWVLKASDLTEEQKKEFIIKDNIGFGEWDMDMLKDWNPELLNSWGLENLDFGSPKKEAKEDDYGIPDEVQTDIKLGDLYQIGRHRLMCGDSIKQEDVSRLMGGDKANMIFTDPPYLMGFAGSLQADGTKGYNAKHGPIKNDKMSKEDGEKFINSFIFLAKSYCEGAYYICFYRLGMHYIFNSLHNCGQEYKAVIIWDKGNHTLSNSDYMSRYEPIIYGWFKEHKFYGNRSNFDIWSIERTKKNELHPTMKPIKLCEKAINNSSEINGIVLDLFLGSGSTMVACEQLNRICYGMELDPKYCQVIIDRMKKLNPEIKVERL